jgi:hypothetical protein
MAIAGIQEHPPDLLPYSGSSRLQCGYKLNPMVIQSFGKTFYLGCLAATLYPLKGNKQLVLQNLNIDFRTKKITSLSDSKRGEYIRKEIHKQEGL